jgi:hypothetical protein
MYIIKKSNKEIISNISYLIENDLDVYTDEFNMVYNE